MKKRDMASLFLIFGALMILLSGCAVAPDHQFEFSPDGGRVAYINYPSSSMLKDDLKSDDSILALMILKNNISDRKTGITIHDLKTGENKKAYEGSERSAIHAIFWAKWREAIYLLESNYHTRCNGDEDARFVFKLKLLDLEKGKAKTVVYNKQDCYKISTEENTTDLLISFDENTGTLSIGPHAYSINKDSSSLADFINKYSEKVFNYEKGMLGDFTVSPDRRHMFFVVYSPADGYRLNLRVLNLETLDVRNIYTAHCDRSLTCMYVPGNVKWSPDGRYVYFIGERKEVFGLNRYDVEKAEWKRVFDKQTAGYDLFSDGKKIFVQYVEDGGHRASIISSDGDVIDTFRASIPGVSLKGASKSDNMNNGLSEKSKTQIVPGFTSVKMSPDGKYAAAIGSSQNDFIPLIYSLEKRDDNPLASTPVEFVMAGMFYAYWGRMEKAVENYEKAGAAGIPGLYLAMLKMKRNGDADALYDKIMSMVAKHSKGDAHFALARMLQNEGDNYSEAARREYSLVEGDDKAMAFYHLYELSKGKDRAMYIENAYNEFVAQGCYRNPAIPCAGKIDIISEIPFQLSQELVKNKRLKDAIVLMEKTSKYPAMMVSQPCVVNGTLVDIYSRAGRCADAKSSYKYLKSCDDEFSTDEITVLQKAVKSCRHGKVKRH